MYTKKCCTVEHLILTTVLVLLPKTSREKCIQTSLLVKNYCTRIRREWGD